MVDKDSVVVSVVVPVFNVAEFLEECLDSIAAQTHPNLEIICVDDGSTDGSRAIIESRARLDMRISLLTQTHSNAGVARNLGLKAATGDFLAFLDSDDYFEPDYVEKLLAAALRFDADIVACRSSTISYKTGMHADITWALPLIASNVPFVPRDLADLFNQFVGWPWDKLFRRSLIQREHLWFQSLGSTNDAYFVYTGLWLANTMVIIDDRLVHHRVDNPRSIESTRQWGDFFRASDAIERRLRLEDIWDRAKPSFLRWVVKYCMWSIRTLPDASSAKMAARLIHRIDTGDAEVSDAIGTDGSRYLNLIQSAPTKVALELMDMEYENTVYSRRLADTQSQLRDAETKLTDTEQLLSENQTARAYAEQLTMSQDAQIASLESQLSRYAFVIRPIRTVNRVRRLVAAWLRENASLTRRRARSRVK